MEYGIDLSHWNALVDADAVRANGITYAWCKATDGASYVDPTFMNKVAQLRAAGIVVGAYHFMHGQDVRGQAQHFKQVASVAGCLAPGALVPMLDMETADVRGNANAVIREFYDELMPGIAEVYGNSDWWRNVLRPETWGDRNIVGHIARYNGDPGNPGWSYTGMAFHQHTSGGTVPGIPGNVDRNVTMQTYTLDHLCIGGVVQSMPTPAPQARPAPTGDEWIVQPGDTLSRIASAWNVTVSALAAANGIPNPDMIFVNQVIHRPDTLGAAPPPVAGSRYQIAPGDTLSSVAAAHGTTVAVLTAINHIANPDRIYAGEWLTLPAAGATPIPPVPARVYVVKPGDTLSRIATALHYPGGYPALAARNNITNPNRIFTGQRLYY